MSDIRAIAAQPRPDRNPGLAPADAPDAPSFADWLAGIVDREGGTGDERPFGNGTMRATVEVFAAHGLLAGATPAAVADHARTIDASPVASAPVHTANEVPSLAPPAMMVAGLVPPPMTTSADAPAQPLLARREVAMTQPAVPQRSPSTTHANAAPMAAPRHITIATEPPPVETASSPPAPARRAPAQGASLKVAVALGGTGVAVSVIGEAVAPEDEVGLHRAVTRLLARHGLMLGELRIARRPGAGGQQQGRT